MKVLPKKPLSVWRPLNLDDFLLGVPHYPEHVDESYWLRDAERMKAAGFNTVRMGEFAWHLWEPYEGKFDFDLFDRAIEILGKTGINTILCTPTATPPRWMTLNYPEILRVDRNGRQASHGSRQHGDTTSPVLRHHSRRITRALAEHYKDNPYVIGWQTDNELNTTVSESYSDSTALAFRNYLRHKYADISALNFAWGGNFWATAYDNFDQVVLPIPMAPSFLSPGHVQDYHRFLAQATADFQRDQVEIIKDVNNKWFVFHNLGNLADIDFRGQFGQDLDFIGFDIYPMLYDEMRRTGGHGVTQALQLDICRSHSGNFIVPEQASGFGSQPAFSTMTPEPGEMRRMAMSSVARGADGLMFFRWRPAHYGAEIYWMGLIDHDDEPRRRYHEACQFASDINLIKNELLGTSVAFDIGIAGADFDNQEAHKTYPMGLPSPQDDATLFYRHCYESGISCGFIHPEDDLSRLKVLYVPHWLMWQPKWTEKVTTFVENGGTLLVSAMTGTRDTNNHIPTELAPVAGLSALLGIKVEEFGRLASPQEDGLFTRFPVEQGIYNTQKPLPACSANRRYQYCLNDQVFDAAHLYEVISHEDDVHELGQWKTRFMEGKPLLTSRSVGKGQACYVTTYLTEDMLPSLTKVLFNKTSVHPVIKDLPKGVEAVIRAKDNHKLLFLINTLDCEVLVENIPKGLDIIDKKTIQERVLLAAYDYKVIRL